MLHPLCHGSDGAVYREILREKLLVADDGEVAVVVPESSEHISAGYITSCTSHHVPDTVACTYTVLIDFDLNTPTAGLHFAVPRDGFHEDVRAIAQLYDMMSTLPAAGGACICGWGAARGAPVAALH